MLLTGIMAACLATMAFWVLDYKSCHYFYNDCDTSHNCAMFGSPGIQPFLRHKTLILGLAGASVILLFYVVRQYTAVAKARVTTADMATVINNSSNFDVRNMRTFTTKKCKLSSLSSPSIIFMLLFSMVTVCNSSSCAGCEDLVGASSGIAWDDGYGGGCAAFATEDLCPDYGTDDEGEGAANDKW